MSDLPENSLTRVCVLTPAGRGAIAVVAVRGALATQLVADHFRTANGRPLTDHPISRIAYGKWDGGMGEDLVTCRRGPDAVEIHCHGGTQSAASIVASLVTDGAYEVDWRQWIVLEADSQLEAEAQVALAEATTARTARILLDQYHGALEREMDAILGLLDSDPPAAQARIERLLARAEFGLHLTRPWQVAIVGRPNVGKSTLVNALAGYERAIAFDQPGTTRDIVSVVTAFDGWPVELSDTAGLHRTDDEIELAGIALARERLRHADLVLWLLDATDGQVAEATDVASVVRAQAQAVDIAWDPGRTLIVVNKCDLARPSSRWVGDSLNISAAVETGIEDLIGTVVERLIPDAPAPGEAVPFTARQVDGLRDALQHCRDRQVAAAVESVRRILGSSEQTTSAGASGDI